jgi:hypothetical protein
MLDEWIDGLMGRRFSQKSNYPKIHQSKKNNYTDFFDAGINHPEKSD